MTAIPARSPACAHRRLLAAAPRRRRGPRGAAACALVGVDRALPDRRRPGRGGLAFGTAPVPRCDVIVGPGNAYVTEAKRLVFGEVGRRRLGGPERGPDHRRRVARPAWLAADLLAQAEHGAGAMACLARRRRRARATRSAPRSSPWPGELSIATDNVAWSPCPDRECRAGAGSTRSRPSTSSCSWRMRARCCRGCATPAPSSSARTPPPPSPTTPPAPTTCCPPAVRPASARDSRSTLFASGWAVVELDGPAAAALAPQLAAIADEEGLRAHALSARLRTQ